MKALLPPGSGQDRDVGIYIHWPFCEKKCPYCDFNSHVRAAVDHEAWADAFLREIRAAAALFPALKPSTIFFGGGTPSLMPPDIPAKIIAAVKKCWPEHSRDMEITLEANPSSVEAGRFTGYRDAGINRLSIGIQSLDDNALRFLGRLHNAASARRALTVAQETFNRVSFDLIYALPGQSLADWENMLRQALDIAPAHLSLYQLTLEPGTGFWADAARGRLTLPDDDHARALFDRTQEIMEAHGMPAYEISNHARAGDESRHNLIYWTGGAYLGFGPGAHGRLPRDDGMAMTATAQIKKPERWLAAVREHGWGGAEMASIDPEDRLTERLMMGLRLRGGVDLGTIGKDLGLEPKDYIDQDALAALVDAGLLAQSGTRLWLTADGRPVLNAVLGKLLA